MRSILKRGFSFKLNPKFPIDTVAGQFKVAVQQNFMFDSVRFDQQKFNWNLKEFDRYSSAFAYGLVESGYKVGDKLIIWIDQKNSAEILVSQMGAAKAGVVVVSFSEKDNIDSLHQTLKDSQAKGLIFSPSSQTTNDGQTRQSFLQKLMPSLEQLYPGDALKLTQYPYLKQIIQTGHQNIRGVIKYKDSLVYANASLSGFTLPQNDQSNTLFTSYRNGKVVSSFSNGEIAEKSLELWKNHFSLTSGDIPDGKLFNVEVSSGQTEKPVFLSIDLETPLGFSAFLANSSNHRKVFVPSTFNMSTILKSVKAQESVDLVCDQEFYELEPPGPLAQEYKDMCQSVKNTIVGGNKQIVSQIFNSKTTLIDPLTF